MNEYYYETGSTQPPKSSVWIVLLLVLLIFVGGIITALGILNVKLWSTFSAEKEEAVSLRFTRELDSSIPQYASAQPAEHTPDICLGFSTETVSEFLQAYYNLPQGVYIPHVTTGSSAEIAGILPGDILLAINGECITDTEMLSGLLRRHHGKSPVELTIFRDGKTLSVDLILH